MKPERKKITLVENSLSFLEEALQKAVQAEKEPIQWKFAVFSIVQSIELLLKERLRREHRLFIYQNIDKPTKTVGMDYAIKRLKEISYVKFSKDDIDAIETASKLRHQIVHHEFDFSPIEIKLVFAKLLGFCKEFYTRQFDEVLEDYLKTQAWEEALSIFEFEVELGERAVKQIHEEKIYLDLVMQCPTCLNETFVFQDDINRCYVCGYREDVFECETCQEFYFESDRDDSGEQMCARCAKIESDKEDYLYEMWQDRQLDQ